jgi:O-antigen ligase
VAQLRLGSGLGYDAVVARKQPQPPPPSRWPIRIAAGGFFLAEVAVLAGAASPFRLPKEAMALAALCVAMGLAVLSAARRHTLVLPRGRLAAVLMALPALQLISALWSASPLRSVESALLTLIWAAGFLWLATIDSDGRRWVFVAAATGVAVSVIVMLAQLAGVSVFNFAAPFANARMSLTGLTGNPADLAMAAVLLLPFFLTWGEASSRPWFFRTLAVLFALATLISQTLTGIAALGLVILVWLVHRRSRRLWVAVPALGALVIAVGLAAGLGDRLQREVGRVRTGNWYRLLSARGDGWTAAEQMIRDHSVLGVGAAAYTHQYYPSRLAWLTHNGGTGGRNELASHFQWAHCDPLQVTAELGIPGVLWMVLFGWALMSAGPRAGPILPLTAAAATPFLLLHYPTHLAVGLIPIGLCLAHTIASDHPLRTIEWRRARVPVAIAAVIFAAAGAFWQLRRVAVDVWMGGLEMRMSMVQGQDPGTRARMGTAVESQILPRLGRLGVDGPALWRTLGRARLLRQDAAGAETAFRTSYAGWPHEDADFYLGMSLNAQGRRNEAVVHLSRVCRTNPKLVDLITDTSLQRTVREILDTY